MKYPRSWEPVTDDHLAGCARLKVPGGWLVVAWVNPKKKRSERLPESLVFVPDIRHEWPLEGTA